jgi:predicted nucleic acid-binding protein
MSKSIVFDTSIYIRALRQGNTSILRQRQNENFPLWLSAVVLKELYVGASDRKMIKILTKFESEFTKINRLLVPNQPDWSIAGQVLNKIGEKYGFDKVGKARLTNDTLLAMSVVRTGLKLLTANAKDFQLISEFREFDWEVI